MIASHDFTNSLGYVLTCLVGKRMARNANIYMFLIKTSELVPVFLIIVEISCRVCKSSEVSIRSVYMDDEEICLRWGNTSKKIFFFKTYVKKYNS